VMEKVASIVARATAGWPASPVCLVGGSVTFPGFADVVSESLRREAIVPVSPLFVTPLGIALSAPAREPAYGPTHTRELSR